MAIIVLLDVNGHVLDHTRYLRVAQTYQTIHDISENSQSVLHNISLGVHDRIALLIG